MNTQTNQTIPRNTTRQAFASDGTTFDPTGNRWTLRTRSGSAIIDFNPMMEWAHPAVVEDAKRPMKLLVETRNLNTARAAFNQFRALLLTAHQRRNALVGEIDAEDVASWVATNGQNIAQLRIFTDVCQVLCVKAIANEAYELIHRTRRPKKSEVDAVRTWDPLSGPYRPAEDAALKAALDDAFNEGSVSLYDYAVARVFRGLGMRPAQAAAMKVCDLRREGSKVDMRIPIVKQRGVPERGNFMPWKPITQGLAEVLSLHIAENIEPRLIRGDEIALAPLFPPKTGDVRASYSLEGHGTTDLVAKSHARVFERLAVISPLTGEPIHVNARRERHTVLTSLAMNGCSLLEIAANAGHSSPESCQPYVDATIDHFQRMERLVGEAFIPIADRFLGKVVRQGQDRKATDEPAAVLRTVDLTGVGSCEVGGCTAVEAGEWRLFPAILAGNSELGRMLRTRSSSMSC